MALVSGISVIVVLNMLFVALEPAPCCAEEMVMKRVNSSGFSIVELLVVVSILAVLVSLLLPAMGQSREAAKTVLCMSRMRDMHSRIEQYRSDYKGWYPVNYVGRWGSVDGTGGFSTNFVDQLDDYMGPYYGDTTFSNRSKKNHFLCPSDYYQPVVTGGSADAAGIRLTAYISTGWRVTNFMMSGVFGYGDWYTQGAQYRPRKEIRTVSPSLAAMMSEINSVSPVFGYVSSWGSANIYPHLNGTNVVFAGGNVKTFVKATNVAGQGLYVQNGAQNGLQIWFQ
jgi:prepilin-type N-terminal cleavage/methylation domain-containing protein/prepilin-type processing-associated H-X9-DG protein